jgi:RND family efflux transporter MFP subunit
MSRTLTEELASLRIERQPSRYRGSDRRGRGLGLLSALFWLFPVAILAGAGAVAYVQYDKIKSKPEVTTSQVQSMTSGEAEKLLSAKGYIQSRHQAKIGTRGAGRVERILIEEGTKVKKGDVIAILEHNDLDALLESRKAMVKRSEAELNEAKADLADKELKAKRWTKLRTLNQASMEEAEQRVVARDMCLAKVEALGAAIRLAVASLHETEEIIRNMTIRAPFDGTVVSKEADLGETIIPGGMGGNSGRGAVVTLANLDMLEVETDIAENLMARITYGQPAEIAVSAVPGKHYRGRLRTIIPMGDRTRGTVKVKVQILDADERLFPELVATVHFLPDKALNNPDAGRASLFVAKAAILEESGHSRVWVVDAKSVVRKRTVEVVVTNDDLARVESGLKAGEQVVINPPKTLKNGEAVKVAE